ncbi:MAG: NERD domain-containing protein [Anaerolineae bacterium]|nr:NERD domain-containing protein [Anaerolineae bacterium]
MENIIPSSNYSRRSRFYLLLGGMALFGGLIAFILGVMFFFFPLWESGWFGLFRLLMILTGFATFVIGIIAIVRGLTLQKDNRAAYEVGEVLNGMLADTNTFPPNEFKYLRNVSKRGVGYIDAVLIGPPGALVFRIVEYTGIWRNERADWHVQKNNRWRPAPDNPTRECVRDVEALRKFLKKRGLERVPVYGVVVFHTEPGMLTLSAAGADSPVVPISETHHLGFILKRDYLKDQRIDLQTVRRAVDTIIDG